MKRRRISRVLPVLACLLLLTAVGGCDDAKTDNDRAAQPADKPVDPQPKKPVPPLDNVPQTADAAVQAVIDGLKDNNPRAVWDFLPAGYQRDITGLVHAYAAKMDVEMWNHSFQTAGRLMVLLKTKKELLLKSPALKLIGPMEMGDFEKNWDPAIDIVTTLTKSDIADLNKLRTIAVGSFLETTGSRLLTQLDALSTIGPEEALGRFISKELSGVRVELDTSKESTGTTAWILLTPPTGKGEPESIQFVRVEGKWIPHRLADGWERIKKFLRLQLEKTTPEEIVEVKRDLTVKLDEADRMIELLQKSQTDQEFNKQLALFLPTAAKLFRPQPVNTGPADPLLPDTDPVDTDLKAAVIIIIHAKLNETQEDVLCEQLMGLVDNKNLALAGVPVFRRGITTIEITPVADVAAFARKIKFADVVSVDLENRAVLIKLIPPAKSK